MKRWFILLLFTPIICFTQNNTHITGFLPSLNLNKKLPQDWSLNSKIESRQLLFQEKLNYNYALTDVSIAGAKKVSINTSAALGYLLRIEDNNMTHRLFQQINILSRYPYFLIGHRISSDQTFEKNNPLILRFRYRITLEKPLKGESLDPKELFVKISHENLHALQTGNYSLEIRFLSFMGYVVNPKSKIELGLDYRVNGPSNQNITNNRYWIALNFYQSL